MTKRIFRSIFLVALAVFVASLTLVMGVLYAHFSEVQRDQLIMQTDLAVQGIEHEGAAYFKDFRITGDYRITWVSADGAVLYDSRLPGSEMPNHLDREEIREALENGSGESARYSDSVMQRSLYIARRLSDGTVVRLSVAQYSVWMLLLGMIQPIAIVMIVAVVLSLVLASRLAKHIVKPLNDVDLDKPLLNEEYDELKPLLRRIDDQQRLLKQQSRDLQRRKDEWDALTSDMNEGLVLLNEKGNILSINHAAKTILGTNRHSVGRYILTVARHLDLEDALYQAQTGKHFSKVVNISGREFQLDASPVVSHGSVSGVVLLLFDVTEQRQAEQMRREFTANVSHELKTPLHAISGYAELMKNGLVKPEDIDRFSDRIYTEAHRMIRLIEDIIHLSHLDESVSDLHFETVDLFAMAQETVEGLRPQAEAAGLTLELAGESVALSAVPQMVSAILFNLCVNAIKYNRPSGRVSVRVYADNKTAVLTVEDTGIGIPPESQNRIFERFYRVDKSRSKEVGGTGLGLSIVKHAAQVHGATVSLESELNVGSTFTVRFPISR
ncbi:MAG: PAS domain S-box protein [Clostridia bacterium]|nr:PAS domain S-box protein [Clostridia bacterium]